jgi:hypothetical protein
MEETPRKKVTVTSSLIEKSTDQRGYTVGRVVVRGGGITTPPSPLYTVAGFLADI